MDLREYLDKKQELDEALSALRERMVELYNTVYTGGCDVDSTLDISMNGDMVLFSWKSYSRCGDYDTETFDVRLEEFEPGGEKLLVERIERERQEREDALKRLKEEKEAAQKKLDEEKELALYEVLKKKFG